MKKYLVLFLAVITLSSCQKDEPTLTATVNPSITSVKFSRAMVGSSSYIKVELTLAVPDKGSLVRVDAVRGTTRIKNVLTKLETGTSSFTDSANWPDGATPAYYVFILVLADGKEISTNPYEVK